MKAMLMLAIGSAAQKVDFELVREWMDLPNFEFLSSHGNCVHMNMD
jgi:hypothetical protein